MFSMQREREREREREHLSYHDFLSFRLEVSKTRIDCKLKYQYFLQMYFFHFFKTFSPYLKNYFSSIFAVL